MFRKLTVDAEYESVEESELLPSIGQLHVIIMCAFSRLMYVFMPVSYSCTCTMQRCGCTCSMLNPLHQGFCTSMLSSDVDAPVLSLWL